MRLRGMVAILLCLGSSASAQPQSTLDQDPGYLHLRSVAEAGVRDVLKDADSAKFQCPAGSGFWAAKSWRPSRFSKDYGPVIIGCAKVNSKNSFGGYTGFAWFKVIIKDDMVIDAQIDENAVGY